MSTSLLIEAEHGCFRRPEFFEDFVSYDVLPPQNAQRMVDNWLGSRGAAVVTRIGVLSPIITDVHEIVTPSGARRAFVLVRPAYLLDIVHVRGAPADAVRQPEDGAPSVFMGLSAYPAHVTILPDEHASSSAPIAKTMDLGWLPVGVSSGRPRRTIYQRLQMQDGVIDLANGQELVCVS